MLISSGELFDKAEADAEAEWRGLLSPPIWEN